MKKEKGKFFMKYKVSEIFYSIQGEGLNQGLPFIFIRFSNCNLRCVWCDTKYAWESGKEMELEEIIKEVKKFRCRRICITGGEPYLQNLFPIFERLKKEKLFISVETNGTIWQDIKFNWITVSPKKEGIKYHKKGYDVRFRKVASEFKYVITGEDDFEFIDNEIEKPIILQPVDNNFDISKLIIDYIKNNPDRNFRIKLQLHKILNIS